MKVAITMHTSDENTDTWYLQVTDQQADELFEKITELVRSIKIEL